MKKLTSRTLVVSSAALALASFYTFHSPRVEAANGPFKGKIVFESDRDGNREIYLMNAVNGSGPVNLSNNPADDKNPQWSHEGTRIVFDSDRDGNAEIYVMRADGSNQTRLTFNSDSDANPALSLDGSKITFESLRDGNREIYVMNADGTNQTRLTSNSGSDEDPQWSPDGTKIIFQSTRNGAQDIYLMNANGSNQTRLTNGTAFNSDPSFSFDGKKIVFSSKTAAPGGAQIFVMNANGTNPVQLTSNAGDNLSAAFSPDGAEIVFDSTFEHAFEIFRIDSDGGGLTRLTGSDSDNFKPSWQPLFSPESIGVFRPSTGKWFLRNTPTEGSADVTASFGQPGDLPVTGDWDGDGRTDIGVYRGNIFFLAVLKTIFVRTCATCPFVPQTTLDPQPSFTFGQVGDLPVAGDWDGDGADDIGVFRNGQFLLRQPTTICLTSCRPGFITFSFNFGQAGDQPVAGDWNGDGKDTVGVLSLSASVIQLRNSNSAGAPDISFTFGGLPTDKVFMGDWNGDGIDTLGILRDGQYRLLNVNAFAAADLVFNFGQPGDIPVAGDWDGANSPPNSGVNEPGSGSSRAGEPQTFTTNCSDPNGWHDIATIDFKIAKSDGEGNGVPLALWVQFDEGSNLIRFYDPDLQTWQEGVPGANVVLSSRFADIYLSGTHVLGSGPTGISVQVTWQIVFKDAAIKNNYKQYLRITDDAGLTTGFDKVGSWTVTK